MTPDASPGGRLRAILSRLRTGERSITTDALRIYVLQGATMAVGLAANVLVARALGPAEKGRVDLFLLVLTILVEFGLFGIGSGLLYQLANRGRSLAEVHGTGLAVALGIGAVTAAVGVGLQPLWPLVFPGTPPALIALAFVLAPAMYYRQIWANCMTGINRAQETYGLGLAITAGNLLAYAALWATGRLDAMGVAVASGGVAVLAAGVAFLGLRRREPERRVSWTLARDAWRTGWVLSIGLLANVLHFRLAQALLNAWVGPEAVGVYAVAVRWAEMLFVLDAALLSAALYRISSAPDAESAQLTRRLFWAQAAISGGVGLALAGAAWPIVHGLYGAAYGAAVWPLVLLIPGVICWSLAKVLSQYLAFKRGRMGLATGIALLGLGLNLGLNILLIPAHGIIGAALASVGSYALVLVLTAIAFRTLARS